MRTLRHILTLLALVAVAFGQTTPTRISLPLDDGSILFANIRFLANRMDWKLTQLTFTTTNQTSSEWTRLGLQFDIGALCNGEPRQWTKLVEMRDDDHMGRPASLPIMGGSSEYHGQLLKLEDFEFYHCQTETEIFKIQLTLAETKAKRIIDNPPVSVDLKDELLSLRAKHEAEAIAQAEMDRAAAAAAAAVAEAQAQKDAAQAKKNAAEAVRRRQLAAEQKRKQAEAQAADERKAEEAAAEERRKVRTACSTIYQNTVDKKISNLTVREEQQVRACQTLGLYPPQ